MKKLASDVKDTEVTDADFNYTSHFFGAILLGLFCGVFLYYTMLTYVSHGFFGWATCSHDSFEMALARLSPVFFSILLISLLHFSFIAVLGDKFRFNINFLRIFLICLIIPELLLPLGTFCIGKPVIYLYPEEPSIVSVKLVTDGVITVSDPHYPPGGWVVYSEPSGLIDGSYPYLFYEADVVTSFNVDEGWIISRDEITSWFDEYLSKFGLNQQEINDFREYWDINLPYARYYRINLISEEKLNSMVKLDVEPEPDTVIRVIVLTKPLDTRSELPEPEIHAPERKGFTVVEWGVILDSS
jgi:hypothetical protein